MTVRSALSKLLCSECGDLTLHSLNRCVHCGRLHLLGGAGSSSPPGRRSRPEPAPEVTAIPDGARRGMRSNRA